MDVLIEALLDGFEGSVMGSHLAESVGDIMRVARLAAYGHHNKGDKRQYTGEPYIVHPMEVAKTVMSAGGTAAMVKAGLAHDTLEHGAVSADDLLGAAGEETFGMVVELTDVNNPSEGNRAARKAKIRERLSKASEGAKSVKLADVLSNSKSIADRAPSFAQVYIKELTALLQEMQGGSPAIRAEAVASVNAAAMRLSALSAA